MSVLTVGLLATAAAYLIGSVPSGYLMGRLLRGIDIRQHGSGSTGATNVLRTLGKGPGLVVILADFAKGLAAVAGARWLIGQGAAPEANGWADWIAATAGLAVVVGHSRSIWLGFSGGKSAATGLGVLMAISWPIALGAALTFGLVLAVSRIVSLSSMSAAVTAAAVVVTLPEPAPFRLLVIVGGAFVVLRHRANIGRLLAGVEPRIGQPLATAPKP